LLCRIAFAQPLLRTNLDAEPFKSVLAKEQDTAQQIDLQVKKKAGPSHGYEQPAPPTRPKRQPRAWLIFNGDVHVGTIGMRSGNPTGGDQWSWHCGFYPGSNPGDESHGTAAT
jgi:hypothetical protein